MTIKDYISRHPVLVRRVLTFVLMACLVVLDAWDDARHARGARNTWILPVGIALILTAMSMWNFRHFRFKCASCHRSLSAKALVFVWSKPACPHCGANFDNPTPASNKRVGGVLRTENSTGGHVTPELPMTYRARPMKKVLLALGSGIFVAIGRLAYPLTPFAALVTIIIFSLIALVGIVGSLPGSSYLTLTEQGFLVVSLFRKRFVAWSNVQSFVPVKIQRKGIVGWNHSPGFSQPQRRPGIRTTFAGLEAVLPDTYGMSSEQLASLMNTTRDAHAKSAR